MFELGGIRSQLQQELARVRVTGPDGSDGSVERWVDLVGQCQEAINVLAAIQTVALARVAAIEDVVTEDGMIAEEFRGLGHQRLDAGALVAHQLGLTCSGATDRVAAAVDLLTRHRQLVEVMAAGRLDAYRAGVVAEELAEADPDVCADVVARLGVHLGTEPGGSLRRRVRRTLAAVDADLVRVKAAQARAERSLRRTAFAAGVDEWSAKLPVEDSRTAWSVVDALARRYVTDGRCAGIEAARADALLDLIHARATGQVDVQLTVPASALTGQHADATDGDDGGDDEGHDELVPVTGFGMAGVTHVRASWLASLVGAVAGSRRFAASQEDCVERADAATAPAAPTAPDANADTDAAAATADAATATAPDADATKSTAAVERADAYRADGGDAVQADAGFAREGAGPPAADRVP
jgi:hypothetical protein